MIAHPILKSKKRHKNNPQKIKKYKLFEKECLTFRALHGIVTLAFRRGGIPEWPKGADCKSVVSDFGGSNPPSPTKTMSTASRRCFLFWSNKGRWIQKPVKTVRWTVFRAWDCTALTGCTETHRREQTIALNSDLLSLSLPFFIKLKGYNIEMFLLTYHKFCLQIRLYRIFYKYRYFFCFLQYF